MPPSLADSFNENYDGGRAGYESPDDRPETLEEAEELSSRWQQLWMLEEMLGIELEIWSKNRAKLNTSDIEEILSSLLEELDAVPVIVDDLMNQRGGVEE